LKCCSASAHGDEAQTKYRTTHPRHQLARGLLPLNDLALAFSSSSPHPDIFLQHTHGYDSLPKHQTWPPSSQSALQSSNRTPPTQIPPAHHSTAAERILEKDHRLTRLRIELTSTNTTNTRCKQHRHFLARKQSSPQHDHPCSVLHDKHRERKQFGLSFLHIGSAGSLNHK
jgi:hypothetical protein